MGRVVSRQPGLTVEQLARIDALAHQLHERTHARSVVVTVAGGAIITLVGEPIDAASADACKSITEKLAGRLRVHVRYDERTSMGLVRHRLRYFAEEIQSLVAHASH